MNRGDICLVSSEPNFAFTLSEEDLWEEIDERLWESRLYKSTHFHDENLEVACNKDNPLEEHEISRLAYVNRIDGESVELMMLDLADPEWDFEPDAMTDKDIHLDTATTGFEQAFVLSTDVIFSVFAHQLSRPVLTLPDALCDKIDSLDPSLNIGTGSDDLAWKQEEVHDAGRLTSLKKSTTLDGKEDA